MTRTDMLQRDEVVDARAFYLQQAFRALLDAMARPGEVVELPKAPETARADAEAAGLFPATMTACDVLLDAATGVAVCGATADRAHRILSRRSHVRIADAAAAPYAVLPATAGPEAARAFVTALSPGTLADPHLGATCIVECGTLLGTDADGARTGSASGACPPSAWVLAGPGIAATAAFETDRSDALQARIDRADEFPCGIDLVLVDRAGHALAVPRSSDLRPAAGGADGASEKGAASWDM